MAASTRVCGTRRAEQDWGASCGDPSMASGRPNRYRVGVRPKRHRVRTLMQSPVDAYLGLGANLGDRAAALRGAVDALRALPGTSVVAVSEFRETAPVGGPEQPDYLNGAVHLRTSLPATALFHCAKTIESDFGREPVEERNTPRPLDIDILLFGDERIDTPALTVPHPRMHERAFVLDPLRDLGVESPPEPIARPIVLTDLEELRGHTREVRAAGHCVGLVPTMGALHVGHRSLLDAMAARCTYRVATIFVNPLQFGQGEDLDRYPRTFDEDLAMCREAGVDLVFAPSADAMYPERFVSNVAVGPEAEGLEADQRPGHFEGVATVVAKLWSLVSPDFAFFGQKDAQQVAVLRRLHEDLGLSGELVECPTVREHDGLALSSRNRYLSEEDREAATVIPRALGVVEEAFESGERSAMALAELAMSELQSEPLAQVDYLELREADTLGPLPIGPIHRARLLVAARFGTPPTRLLDNLVLGDADSAEEEAP